MAMIPTKVIHNSFFEDHNSDYIFYYTGKNNIIGLNHPDYIYNNLPNYTYARVAFYKYGTYNDLMYINETIRCVTIYGSEDASVHNKSFTVHIESSVKNGRVVSNCSSCTISIEKLDDGVSDDIEIFLTEDTYETDDGSTAYGVGVWVKITDCKHILTESISSLSYNSAPINADYYESGYIVEYLTNSTAINEVNLLNISNFITDNCICSTKVDTMSINSRLEALEDTTKYMPQFIQNSVLYDNTYQPSAAGSEEIVSPLSIRSESLDRIITLDSVNKGFRVNKSGIYALQLKQGFYLDRGESALDLIVYKNDDVVKEMGISCYLTSKDTGVIKNLYSSNVFITSLRTTDLISLKTMWTDITDINVENETMISVTYLVGADAPK